jgi:hypothetical protein
MRPSVLAACASLSLLTWPVHAQVLATSPSGQVVFDATVMVVPPTVIGPGVRLAAGQLTVDISNTGSFPWGGPAPDAQPVGFRLFSYLDSDPRGRVDVPVTADGSTATVPLAGGVYCWVLDVDAPVSTSTAAATRTNYSQFVALRMTLAPR